MFCGEGFIRPLVIWSRQIPCRSVPLIQQYRQFLVKRQFGGFRQSRLLRIVNLAEDSSNDNPLNTSVRFRYRGDDYLLTLRRGAVTVHNLLRDIQDEFKLEFSSYVTARQRRCPRAFCDPRVRKLTYSCAHYLSIGLRSSVGDTEN